MAYNNKKVQLKKKSDLKISGHGSFDINIPGHKKANKGSKIYNKGMSTDNPHEKDAFLKKSGPLPTFFKKVKRKTKKNGKKKTG